ncbi:hypothetical protein [Terrarubrum flagellatum]|uniref:hypothetical protein n=1 Tax=Terrirubrum flagellatum TaxID=2895980 RepID=UPI003145203A
MIGLHGLVASLVFVSSAVAAAECGQLEQRAEATAKAVAIAADERGATSALAEIALEGVRECPSSEPLWFFAARAAELRDAPLAATGEASPARAIAEDAAKAAPRSARILTIVARWDGSSEAARRALALDASYAPAQWALALALAREGASAEGMKVLGARKESNSDRIARAEVFLAAGQPLNAVAPARAAATRPNPDPSEFSTAGDITRRSNEALGLALVRSGKKADGLKALRIAASLGSRRAQSEIDKLK